MKKLVSTAEAAQELGVAPSTLRAWPGRYDFVKPALITERGHYRWDLDELLRICDPHDSSIREGNAPASSDRSADSSASQAPD